MKLKIRDEPKEDNAEFWLENEGHRIVLKSLIRGETKYEFEISDDLKWNKITMGNLSKKED